VDKKRERDGVQLLDGIGSAVDESGGFGTMAAADGEGG